MWSERTSPDEDRAPSPELDALLGAYANRDIDPAAEARLQQLGRAAPEVQLAIEDFDRLHRALDAERVLRSRVMAPASPAEEADPVYRKLQRCAAGAEERILEHVRMLPRPRRAQGGAPRRGLPVVLGLGGLAAAAALLLAWWLLAERGAPSLTPGVPDPRLHAGPAIVIVLDTTIDRGDPRLSWGYVANAKSYTVTLRRAASGGGSTILFTRAQIPAGEPTCLIDPPVLRDLPSGSPLELLITAQDSEGNTIASSGDLRVRLL